MVHLLDMTFFKYLLDAKIDDVKTFFYDSSQARFNNRVAVIIWKVLARLKRIEDIFPFRVIKPYWQPS